MSISIFYKKGSAGYVRGEQMADYLGGKKNPTSGFEDDICVYVKHFPTGIIPKRTYIDIDDSPEALEWVRIHPELKSIATTEEMKEFISKEFNIRNIHVIPHAHCNYERWIRPDREIKTVGTIGSKTSFQYPVEEFRDRLKEIGLELSYEQDYWNTYVSTPDMPGRLKVVNFYKTLDIQIIWRHKLRVSRLKNPNKLANAGSFGIPTIANPAEYLGRAWDGSYIPINTIDEMIEEIRKLKNNYNLYKDISNKALKTAEETHIEKIAKLYENL